MEEYATAATALTDQLGARADWSDPITVDGAELTATQVLWPLAQQLTVGAVDLGGAQFAELPTDFLTALLATIIEQVRRRWKS